MYVHPDCLMNPNGLGRQALVHSRGRKHESRRCFVGALIFTGMFCIYIQILNRFYWCRENQYDCSLADWINDVNSYSDDIRFSMCLSLSLESLINYLAMALSLFKFVPEHVAS